MNKGSIVLFYGKKIYLLPHEIWHGNKYSHESTARPNITFQLNRHTLQPLENLYFGTNDNQLASYIKGLMHLKVCMHTWCRSCLGNSAGFQS